MSDKVARLCTICARAGSKGVANKNVREIAGKPLIAHTIAQALESELFEEVAVSSDSAAILDAAAAAGATQLIERPPELATDSAAKTPAMAHAAQEIMRRTAQSFDTFVDLDATAPLREIDDIRGVVALVESGGYLNAFSVAPAHRSPYFNMVRLNEQGSAELVIQPGSAVVRRQDAPEVFDMNASIYAWRGDAFFPEPPLFSEATGIWVMPRERSIDIDEPFDWRVVEWLLRERREMI